MFIFILLNLCLSFLLKTESSFITFFASDFSLYFGILLLITSLIATGFKFKTIAFRFRYDAFATGSILIWFAYWPPFFTQGNPMFEYFPLYFAFMGAFFSLIFNTKAENIDPEMLSLLQWLSDSGRFNPILIMIAIILSLLFPQYFLLFPVTMTLFITRYALANCLNNE